MVTLVGNLLGENQPVNAWRMVRVNIVPWSVFFLVMSALMVIFAGQIATLFSGESEAKDIETSAMIYVALYSFFSCV